jgi:hypothetical protein
MPPKKKTSKDQDDHESDDHESEGPPMYDPNLYPGWRMRYMRQRNAQPITVPNYVSWKPKLAGTQVNLIQELTDPNQYFLIPVSDDNHIIMVLRRVNVNFFDNQALIQTNFTMNLLTAPSITPIHLMAFNTTLVSLLSMLYNNALNHSPEDTGFINMNVSHPEMITPAYSGEYLLTANNRDAVIRTILDQMTGM